MVNDENSGELLADLAHEGDEFVVARGGQGGRGNARFKSSTKRAPRYAQDGLPGEENHLLLELRLLADIGLIGAPNAGKSSLLARISESRPRIADYPFSTLQPILGVVDLGDYTSCVAADIPGLIEGAHEGKGLGSQFLQHIQRTKLLVHVVDLCPPEGTPTEAYRSVAEELIRFDPVLGEKPLLIAPNKTDLPDSGPALEEFRKAAGRTEIYPISAATGEGIPALLHAVRLHLQSEEALVP
jgi:GTP-binding protein